MALRYFCATNISTQHHAIRIAKNKKKKRIRAKAELRNTVSLGVGVGLPSTTTPLESLQRGNWVKLICGASFEDVVDIRNLSLVYTLAGGKFHFHCLLFLL